MDQQDEQLRKALQRQRQRAAAAAATSGPGTRQRKKRKRKRKEAEVADVRGAAEGKVIEALRSSEGSLSDLLNPGHPRHDAVLAAEYRALTKRQRRAVVAADRELLSARATMSGSLEHPFEAEPDDHCESPPEAYRDIAPLLKEVAQRLGKDPAELRIYDPYYCAGAVRRHLAELGFPSVHNECVDFYAILESGRVPAHDILVTNPPYSGNHVERLLRFCRSNAKPFVLLMPNYFIAKPYYEEALGGVEKTRDGMLYLCPKKRYSYWTPKGLRGSDKVQKQHTGPLGHRTSPFISYWYCDLSPVLSQRALLKFWRQGGGIDTALLCKLSEMPRGLRPEMLMHRLR